MEFEYGTVDTAYSVHLATVPPEDDGPIWMVNFMRYRERADYGEAGGPDISGREADDRYSPVEILDDLGAEVAYFGDVVGPDGATDPDWDRMAIVRYPNRRSFIDMLSRPDFEAKRVHKDAGMAFTIIMCCLPTAPVTEGGYASGPVWFTAYPAGAAPGDALGEGATFEVEGIAIGDDRRWSVLEVTWSAPEPGRRLPDGALVVRSVPLIDRIAPLVDDALAGA
jgi:hypothetical protein